MPGSTIGTVHTTDAFISQLQSSLASGGAVTAQIKESGQGGVPEILLKQESKGLRLGLNLITLGIYGTVKDQQVKSALVKLLNNDVKEFLKSGHADASKLIDSTLKEIKSISASKIIKNKGGILDEVKNREYLVRVRILSGEDVKSRASSGASLQEAITSKFASRTNSISSISIQERAGKTTSFSTDDQAAALARLRAGAKFETVENGVALVLNAEGKKNIQASDLQYLGAFIEEHGFPAQTTSTKIPKDQKIVGADLSGAKLLDQQSLIDLGTQLAHLKNIRAENCPCLTEIDHVKNYVKEFFTTSKSSSPSHRAILNYLDKSLFRAGTQHTYFQELKFQFAREALLKDFPGDKSFAGANLTAHQKECAGIILNDIFDHKFHQGHSDAELPNSHNGATRATLTHADLQLLNKGLADVAGVNPASGQPYISNESRAAIKAELNNRVEGFTSQLEEVHDAILNSIPDDSPYKVKDPVHDMAPKSINYGAVINDLKSSDPKVREAAAKVAVAIKAAGLGFADTQGRNFALSDLGKIGPELKLHADLSRTLTAISSLADTYSPEIDDATLQWLVEENHKAASHPRVGIVGGGPTGLFAGLEFFAKGADVKISEARDALFTRHQIVRLDPLWVNKLKFYLGTDFEKYYGAEDKSYAGQSKPKIGNRSGDGFVETVINHLEARLLDRVVLLNSLAESISDPNAKTPDGKPIKPGISVLAAHEVKSKVESKDGEPFVLKSVFKANVEALKEETNQVGVDAQGRPIFETALAGGASDPYLFEIVESLSEPNAQGVQSVNRVKKYILDENGQKQLRPTDGEDVSYRNGEDIPVDIVFDCAGKHSHFKEGNTVSRDVTVSEPHIVASFFVRGECLSYRQENHDFRRQYLISPEFINKTNQGITKSIEDYFEKLFSKNPTGDVELGGKTFNANQFNSLGNKVLAATKKLQDKYITQNLDDYKRVPVQNGERKDPNSVEGEKTLVYETRTFINTSNDFQEAPGAKPRNDGGVAKQADGQDRPDNIVYLGLELPKPIDEFQKALQEQLEKDLKEEIPNADARKLVARSIVGEANLGFVLSIANEQGLDRPRTSDQDSEPWVNAKNADRKFLGAFDVSQGSVPNGVLVRKGPNGRVLIQASGGDSAAAPHFMRYSGLSGAREHVGIISRIVGQAASSTEPLTANIAEQQVASANKNYASINEFVLSRGKVFLESATPLQIANNVRTDLDRLLATGKDNGNMLANVSSQQEAAQILRDQLTPDIEKSKAPGVAAAEKAVWESIENTIRQLESGTYVNPPAKPAVSA